MRKNVVIIIEKRKPILVTKVNYSSMEQNITIKKENAIKAYSNASKEQKELLETLFGKDTFKPQDICDRVKTFEDAVRELGDSHPLVSQYKLNFNGKSGWNNDKYGCELEAYLKLRIITAALNEGWEPKFTKGEYRWYGWYDLITKEQYDKLTDEDKSRAVLRSYGGADAYGGLVCANAYYDSSSSGTSFGSRLAFKSEKLAIYAALQFIEIYADFCFIPKAE